MGSWADVLWVVPVLGLIMAVVYDRVRDRRDPGAVGSEVSAAPVPVELPVTLIGTDQLRQSRRRAAEANLRLLSAHRHACVRQGMRQRVAWLDEQIRALESELNDETGEGRSALPAGRTGGEGSGWVDPVGGRPR